MACLPCSSSRLQVSKPLLEHKPTVWLFLKTSQAELELVVYLQIGGCREEGLRSKLRDWGNRSVVVCMPNMSKILAFVPSTTGRKGK